MFLSLIGNRYVLAAILFVVALGWAGYEGWHQRGIRADAQIAERDAQIKAIRAEADRAVAQAQEKAAQVEEKVVIQYRDRVQVIRQTAPEVEHDFTIIKQSPCALPAEWVRLHNAGAGVSGQASGGADDATATVSCADAIEIVRENYKRSRENAEQLAALQEWAAGVSGAAP